MTTGKRTKSGKSDRRAPAGRRKYDPKRAVEGESANRYGGYGQTGYDEEAADEPGVQVNFDEEVNREAEGPPDRKISKISRKGAKVPRRNVKKKDKGKREH